jgi:hypothetical protein
MFCKICFDSKAPKSVYESHNVKDSSNNTTCPKLLNTKCMNCNYFGHTKSYCKIVFQNNNKNKDINNKSNEINNKSKYTNSVSKPNNKSKYTNNLYNQNKFELLCIESEETHYKENTYTPNIGYVEDIVWGQGMKHNIGKSWITLEEENSII